MQIDKARIQLQSILMKGKEAEEASESPETMATTLEPVVPSNHKTCHTGVYVRKQYPTLALFSHSCQSRFAQSPGVAWSCCLREKSSSKGCEDDDGATLAAKSLLALKPRKAFLPHQTMLQSAPNGETGHFRTDSHVLMQSSKSSKNETIAGVWKSKLDCGSNTSKRSMVMTKSSSWSSDSTAVDSATKFYNGAEILKLSKERMGGARGQQRRLSGSNGSGGGAGAGKGMGKGMGTGRPLTAPSGPHLLISATTAPSEYVKSHKSGKHTVCF